MSRVAHVLCIAALVLMPIGTAQAQSANTPPVVAGTAKGATPELPPESDSADNQPNLAERLLVSPREPRCAEDDSAIVGGITVCGKKKDNSKERLPIPGDLKSATALDDGLPRAPDLMTNRIKGPSIGFRSCFPGVCPPGMLPNIDFRAIPAAPEGSDADKVGKGEIRAN